METRQGKRGKGRESEREEEVEGGILHFVCNTHALMLTTFHSERACWIPCLPCMNQQNKVSQHKSTSVVTEMSG
jgi:hypothetical protein